MALSTNNTITKQDVVNKVNDLRKTIVNMCSWYKASNANYNATDSSGASNPYIFPSGQLGTTDLISMGVSDISDATISASPLYNFLVSFIRRMTAVRNVNYNWYYNRNNVDNLVANGSATVRLQDTTTSVSGTIASRPGYIKNPSGSSTLTTLSITNTLNTNEQITASRFNDEITELLNKFNTYRNNNVITYNYYTCHYNCHSNYSDRARR